MAQILIADDEHRIRSSLKPLFRDHTITTVGTWPELIEMTKENTFHLIITDIVMPGYKEVAKEGIINVFSDRELPVIFMSGYTEQALQNLPPHMKFVSKPFSMRIMKMHADKLLAEVDTTQGDNQLGPNQRPAGSLPPRRY